MLELVLPENPPCNENGRRRRYVDIMKELWDDMGYKNLQLKSQKLRDQASRLEKKRNMEKIYPLEREALRIWGTSHLQVNVLVRKILKMKVKTESGNANKRPKCQQMATRGLNWNSAEPQQIPEESRVTMGDWLDVSDDVFECLLKYVPVNLPASVNWG